MNLTMVLVMVTTMVLLCAKSSSTTETNTTANNIGERGIFEFIFNLSCSNCGCGVSNREARLIGGEFLRGHEFPWLVQILMEDNIIPGTLISDKYILSSASKLIGLTPLDLKVTLGQYDTCFPEASTKTLSIELILLHPDFNPGNRAHDIALVKLSTAVKFDKNVSPICLPVIGGNYIGQVGTVTSWLESNSITGGLDPVSSCRPRKISLPVLGQGECSAGAAEPQYMSLDKGCLGVVGQISPVCSVDGGAGVVSKTYGGIYELIGILSDRNSCETTIPRNVAMYTKIADHLNWIIEKTRDSCYCHKP